MRVNLAYYFRWLPIAVGAKLEPTMRERFQAICTGDPAPRRTQEPHRRKLQHSRLKAELERRRRA